MNKKIPLALALCSTIIALPLQADEQHVWRGIAFGQSTDVNFSSNVLPEKIGVNDVTIAGKKLAPQDTANLQAPITIESRGGKIANSHDGLTFFYTELPARQNFILQATVTVDQLVQKMAPFRLHRRAPGCWYAISSAIRGSSLWWLATKSFRRHPIWS